MSLLGLNDSADNKSFIRFMPSNNGWFVGYVITNHDKYYFSTHLSDEKASGENAKLINEKILKEMGVLNGQ